MLDPVQKLCFHKSSVVTLVLLQFMFTVNILESSSILTKVVKSFHFLVFLALCYLLVSQQVYRINILVVRRFLLKYVFEISLIRLGKLLTQTHLS